MSAQRAQAKVACPIDGEMIVGISDIVLDDDEQVYRFTCAKCGTVEKPFDENIRQILRRAGCATIDDLVKSASVQLRDDERIWRAILTA